MHQLHKYSFLVLIFATIFFGAGCSIYKISAPQNQQQAATATQALPKGAIVIYVADGCSHCAIVESKIRNGLVDKKIPVTFKDVYNNLDNARDMVAKTKICGVPEVNFSVPMLWDGQSCYEGQDKILNYIDLRMKEFNK